MMVCFVLSFFSRDVLDEILHLTESVSEGFRTYFDILSHFLLHYLDLAFCKAFRTVT